LEADGEFVHSDSTPQAEEGDWGKGGTPLRDLMDDALRDRLVGNVLGHLGKAETVPRGGRAGWLLLIDNLLTS
jgi:catalase